MRQLKFPREYSLQVLDSENLITLSVELTKTLWKTWLKVKSSRGEEEKLDKLDRNCRVCFFLYFLKWKKILGCDLDLCCCFFFFIWTRQISLNVSKCTSFYWSQGHEKRPHVYNRSLHLCACRLYIDVDNHSRVFLPVSLYKWIW